MKEFDLTARLSPSTLDVRGPRLNRGGNIFMPEPGNGEQSPKPSEVKPILPKVEQPIIPLAQQDTDILEGEYSNLVSFLATQKGQEREDYNSQLQPRIVELIEELEKRGVNVVELSSRAREGHSEQGPGTPIAINQEFLEQMDALQQRITNPEFKVIIGQFTDNPDAAQRLYEILKDRFLDQYRDLSKKFADLPTDLEGELARRDLTNQLSRLTSEYEAIGQRLAMAMPERERGIDENTSRELDEIEALPPGSEEKNERIRSFMKEYIQIVPPEDEPLSDRILRLIAGDEVATEEFISRLIVSDLEDEPWSMRGFYGNINFEKFQRITRTIITGERRTRLFNLIQANSSFHDMNYILKRSFEQFSQQSERILPQQLEVLGKIPGVDDALTLYEQFYAEARAEETLITEEMAQQIDKKVERDLRSRAAKRDGQGNPVIKGMAGREMEDWELFRASIYARNFFRIMVRAAEHTTLSELPRGDDPSLYVSSPQVKLTQVLNILKYIGIRFKVDEPLGGPELLDRILKYNSEERKKNGVRLKTLQGTSVDMREFQNIIAARGVFATWRNAEIVLRQISFEDEDGKVTNVVQFFLDHSQQIAGLAEKSREKLSDSERQRLKQDTQRLFEPLLKNTSIALGLLASPSGLSNVTPEFKELIWEKIVDLDPAVVASLLTRLETDDSELQFRHGNEEKPQIEALEDILLRVWGTDEQKRAIWGTGDLRKRNIDSLPIEDLGIRELKTRLTRALDKSKTDSVRKEIDGIRTLLDQRDQELKKLFRDERWQGVLSKLRDANKLRVNEEAERIKERRFEESPKSLDDYLSGDLAFNDAEQRVLDAIRENGNKITGDLARIKQSHAWFLDDLPFKDLDWVRLGQFYDRETGDLANFNKGAQGLLKVISNPFGQSVDEVLGEFKEGIDGASMVVGRISAQDNQEPVFVNWAQMIYEKPRFRQLLVEMAMHTFKKPTSRAQEIVGMKGLALNEDGMQDIFDKALPIGVLRKEVKDEKGRIKWQGNYDKIRKQFKTMWYNIAWGKVRDYGPIGIIAFLIQFFKSVATEKTS